MRASQSATTVSVASATPCLDHFAVLTPGPVLAYLAEDFATPEHIGPKRRANFIAGTDDAQLQTEAFGLVATFLRGVGRPR